MNPNQSDIPNSLSELRAKHNERFIRLAYRSILRREVDPEGLHYYLLKLGQNLSPIAFLSDLYSSQEAQLCGRSREHHPADSKFESEVSPDDFVGLSPHIRNMYIKLKVAAANHNKGV